MLGAVDEAIGHSQQRPGPFRLGFAVQATGVTLVSSFVLTQAVMAIASWPDLSFWGIMIFVSILVALIAGLAGLLGDVVVWIAGARLLPTGARVAATSVTHLTAVVGAQAAYATTQSSSMLQDPVIGLFIVVPAVLGAGMAGIAVWRSRPEGPFEANALRRREAWLARSRS